MSIDKFENFFVERTSAACWTPVLGPIPSSLFQEPCFFLQVGMGRGSRKENEINQHPRLTELYHICSMSCYQLLSWPEPQLLIQVLLHIFPCRNGRGLHEQLLSRITSSFGQSLSSKKLSFTGRGLRTGVGTHVLLPGDPGGQQLHQ